MCFQDLVFLPITRFHTFPNNCGRGRGLGAATCLKTMVGGDRWHAPCEILLLCQILSVSLECHGDHKTVTKLR